MSTSNTTESKEAPKLEGIGTRSSGAERDARNLDTDLVVFKTTAGDMVAELWPDVAPKTVQNFKNLAKQGFFDGTTFHRIVKGFMIQGGDPLTKDPANEDRYGQGGPGYTIKDEVNLRKHVRGVLSMAHSGRPNTAGSQFFICLADASYLDKKYTAFGKLIKGEDVLLRIGETPVGATARGENSRPLSRVGIETMRIVAAASL